MSTAARPDSTQPGDSDAPTVEILLAVHNGERYLPDLLDSLGKQTWANLRVVASDDGSTDWSMEMLTGWASAVAGRALLPPASFGSAQANFQRLLDSSRGEYVMFCDQDDVWDADKVEVSMRAMQAAESAHSNTEPILVFTDARVTDAKLNVRSASFLSYSGLNPSRTSLPRLLAQNPVMGCTCLMNRHLVRLLQMQPRGSGCMHDRWAALAASAFGTIVFVPRSTLSYRQHANNVVGARLAGLADGRSMPDYQRSVRESISIARSFLDTYSDLLPLPERESLEAYASLLQRSPARRLCVMMQRRFLKSGFVKALGQMIVVARLGTEGGPSGGK